MGMNGREVSGLCQRSLVEVRCHPVLRRCPGLVNPVLRKEGARWVVVKSSGCEEGGVCCNNNWFESILSCCFSLAQNSWISHFHPDYYSALATLNMSVLCEEASLPPQLDNSVIIEARSNLPLDQDIRVPQKHTAGLPLGDTMKVPSGYTARVPLGNTVVGPLTHRYYWGPRLWPTVVYG